MYARVVTSQFPPDRLDAGVRFIEERLLPSLRQIPGVTASYILVDRQTGNSMAITLFENEATMRAAGERGERLRTQTTDTFAGAQVTSVAEYELLAQL